MVLLIYHSIHSQYHSVLTLDVIRFLVTQYLLIDLGSCWDEYYKQSKSFREKQKQENKRQEMYTHNQAMVHVEHFSSKLCVFNSCSSATCVFFSKRAFVRCPCITSKLPKSLGKNLGQLFPALLVNIITGTQTPKTRSNLN